MVLKRIDSYFSFYSSVCPILWRNVMKRNSAKKDNKKFWEEQQETYLSTPRRLQRVRKANLIVPSPKNLENVVIFAKISLHDLTPKWVLWLSQMASAETRLFCVLYLTRYFRYRCVPLCENRYLSQVDLSQVFEIDLPEIQVFQIQSLVSYRLFMWFTLMSISLLHFFLAHPSWLKISFTIFSKLSFENPGLNLNILCHPWVIFKKIKNVLT